MKRNILFFFTKGNERSVNVKKNIVLMILIKGCSILLSLLLVPLTLDYVDNECYGVISYFYAFDVFAFACCSLCRLVFVA